MLDKNIEDCSIIIPNAAVRDEGLSYHYAPPSDEIEVNLKYISEFTALLDEVKCSYRIGKTWTTDAIYRETRKKMERRRRQGCLCAACIGIGCEDRGVKFCLYIVKGSESSLLCCIQFYIVYR